jgi:hypothetical protein
MKKFWEESDVKSGSMVCVNTWEEDSEDLSGLCSATFKLGYVGGASLKMCLISIQDGLVMSFERTTTESARQVLANEFNSDSLGYRLLDKEQIMRRMNYLYSEVNVK